MGGVCSGGMKKQQNALDRNHERLKLEKSTTHHHKQNRITFEPLQLPFPRELLSMTGASESKVCAWSSFYTCAEILMHHYSTKKMVV